MFYWENWVKGIQDLTVLFLKMACDYIINSKQKAKKIKIDIVACTNLKRTGSGEVCIEDGVKLYNTG